MKKSVELRQERQAKFDAQKKIVTEAVDDKGQKRALNEDEAVRFDALQKEIDDFDKQIARAVKFEENERASAAQESRHIPGAAPGESEEGDGEEKERSRRMKSYSLHKAIRAVLPGSQYSQPLDGVELEMHQETVKRAEKAGVMIEGIAIPAQTRADGQTVTQDSGGYGANLVPTDQQGVIEFLRPRPILEKMGARFLRGLSGNLSFPKNDGGIDAFWEGEIDTTTNTKTAYGNKGMSPNRLGAAVLISLQNLIQSSPDLEAMTVQDINRVVANKLDAAGINGSGTGNVPLGILNESGVNVVAAGTNGLAPIWAHIVEMETKINESNADGNTMGYLINTSTKGKLKTTKHEAGDLNYLMTQANTINGYNVGVSNLVPNNLTKGTGTNLSAAIFGDFSQFIMGQWGFYDLTVDNISKKKDGNIELIVNAFYDCMVRQDKAFSVVKDWITA